MQTIANLSIGATPSAKAKTRAKGHERSITGAGRFQSSPSCATETGPMVLSDQDRRFYDTNASSLMARKPHLTPS